MLSIKNINKKLACCVVLLFLLSMLFNLLPVTVYAEPIQLDNNGNEMANPYGDSKIPPSFSAPYYDCYIPYNLTPMDIGGYALSASESGNMVSDATPEPMPTSVRDDRVCSYVVREFSWSYFSGSGLSDSNCNTSYMYNSLIGKAIRDSGSTVEDDPTTGIATLTTKDGTKFYITAIQAFFYNNSSVGNPFPTVNEATQYGQLVDIILTDGSVYHFIVGDENAKQHTNGGDPNVRPGHNFDAVYVFSDMLKPQYKNLFSAAGNNSIEVWGKGNASSSLINMMNLGTGEGKNRIAYYRMYNATLIDPSSGSVTRTNWSRNAGVPADVHYSLGDVSIDQNGGGGDGEDGLNLDSLGRAITLESDLTGLPAGSTLSEDANHLTSVDDSGLTAEERYNTHKITSLTEARKTADVWDFVRRVLVFIGLLILSYVLVLIMAYLFDRVNTVFDIRFVTLFSLGALSVGDKDQIRSMDSEGTKIKGLLSERKFVGVCVVLAVVGALLVSGGVLPFVMKGVNWLMNQF